MNDTVLNIGMYVTYALVAVAALSAVIFPVIFFVQDFRKAKRTLLGLVVLATILLISYAVSTNEVYENAGPVASQWIGGGITATMVLIGLGLATAVFTEVYKFFR